MVGVGSLINGSQNSVWLLALEDEFRGIITLVPEVFLEPRESREAAKTSCEAARREKPLVTLDFNLTFMQTPGSGSDPHARIG